MKNYSKWSSPRHPYQVGVAAFGTVARTVHAKTAPCNPFSERLLYELASAVSKASPVCLGETRPTVYVIDKGDTILIKVNAYAVNLNKYKFHSVAADIIPIMLRLRRFQLGWRQQHRNRLILKSRCESAELDRYRWSSEPMYVAAAIGYMIGKGRGDDLPPPAALVEIDATEATVNETSIRRVMATPNHLQPLFTMETK